MTDKLDTGKVEKAVDEIVKDMMDGYQDALPDEEVQAIVELMQSVEDKLSVLLAHFGVEVGDERVD